MPGKRIRRANYWRSTMRQARTPCRASVSRPMNRAPYADDETARLLGWLWMIQHVHGQLLVSGLDCFEDHSIDVSHSHGVVAASIASTPVASVGCNAGAKRDE